MKARVGCTSSQLTCQLCAVYLAQDILTARMLFPSAKELILVADLTLGRGLQEARLSCFSNAYCVRMVSRGTYRVIVNLLEHQLGWLETAWMKSLFNAKLAGGCLATVLFCLHLSSPHFANTFELVDSSIDGQFAVGSVYHGHASNASINASTVRSASVRSDGLRVTFVSATLQDDSAFLHSLQRLVLQGRGLLAAGSSFGSDSAYKYGARSAHLCAGRHVTIIKAAPSTLTSMPWFYSWALRCAAFVVQDETGIPVATLRSYGREGGAALVLRAFGSYKGMQLGRRFWNIDYHAPDAHADLHRRRRPTRQPAAVALGSGDRELQALLNESGTELKFPFGYAASDKGCQEAARRAGLCANP